MQAVKSEKRKLIDLVIELLPNVSSDKINNETFWMNEDDLNQLIEKIHEGKRNEFFELINS